MNNDQHLEQMAAGTLAAARHEAGVSLRELARRAGTSHPTLLAYETGRKSPSITVFLRILNACGYAVDFQLSPRVRWKDGIPRGEELESVLALAAEFPARSQRKMDYPTFPSGR